MRFDHYHPLDVVVGVIILTSLLLMADAGSCPGVCQDNSSPCSGSYSSGLCPGGSTIQCCLENTPSCTGSGNQCRLNTLPCSGTYKAGLCPGSSAIQCCVSGSTSNSSCPASTLFSIGGIPIQQLTGDTAFFWLSGLNVDADGSPNAYNPENTGIDYLANAGSPGNWWGIATDSNGNPYIQGQYPPNGYAPYPGYYVSNTSLEYTQYSAWDPRRYVNAVNMTFFVLPGTSAIRNTGVKLGDYGFIYWSQTGRSVYAIYADVGPTTSIGEGSVLTNVNLGSNPYNSKGRVTIGIDSGVYTVVFPGSGAKYGIASTQTQINTNGAAAFAAWGGLTHFKQCIL